MSTRQVTVVGGGITGLAAAWELVRGGARVTVMESSDRLGGRIVTEEVGGRPVDLGPDSFISRQPDAVQLCQELGLGGDLVGSATESASLWTGTGLRRLPGDTILGAPAGLAGLAAVARSGILSPAGVARAALDLALPRRELTEDPSVADVVAGRFGRQLHERLVDPLVGGIHAGPSSGLSARATAPQLLAGAGANRSLLLGLGGLRRSAVPPVPGPTFLSLPGGVGQLVRRLEEALRQAGVVIHLGGPVEDVATSPTTATIVTTPAPVTAALVAGVSPDAAAELAGIEHASVTLTVLRYPMDALPGGRPPPGSGFLVPERERRLMTACSFASSKWPHWAAPGEMVLRVSAGRWGDGRALALEDAELVDRLHRELSEALGLTGEPLSSRVGRWPTAFPQYRPGHLDRVARVEAALARDSPGVIVAGAAFRGVGIPACIAQGRAAARRALGL